MRGAWLAVLVLGAAPALAQDAPAAAPAPAGPPTLRDCPDCPALALVPAQSAVIGAGEDMPDRRRGERGRATAVIAAPFAMGVHEVTRAQFAAFVRETGYVLATGPRPDGPDIPEGCNYWNGGFGYAASLSWRDPGYVQRETEPVVCVSVRDATAYLAWLTRKTGRVYRLPSSVEWEVAARAGSPAAWPWGGESDTACEHANVADRTFGAARPDRPVFPCTDGYATTSPVGRFRANAYGLFDMIGNAWEWTADCWRTDLAGAPLDGRAITAGEGGDCAFRTPHGGAWISGPGWARPSARSRDPEVYRSFILGFRVAAALTPDEAKRLSGAGR